MKFFSLGKNNIDCILDEVRKVSDSDTELDKMIFNIIQDVKKKGDEALIEYTKQFDVVSLKQQFFRISDAEARKAYDKVSEKEIHALNTLKSNIETVEQKTLDRLCISFRINGFSVRQITKPLESIGCYIPGGKASYPSTLLMTAVPAKVAGVNRIVVVTPPSKITPLLLVAADIAGVSEIYRIGGVQAIAALAYGTETIKPVDKVIGPGNAYVTRAKTIVSRDIQVDMPAGPTEIIIYADDKSDPRSIALDMISQAEHGPDSICGLITCSSELAEKVMSEVSILVKSVDRKEIVVSALDDKGFVLVADSKDTVVNFVNRFAPEHFEVISENFNSIIAKIKNVGLIIVNSPSVLTDYYVGVNHVLPTNRYAMYRGGLTVVDFVKLIRIVIASKSGVIRSFPTVEALALNEGLINHMKSVEYMVKNYEI